MEEFRRRSLSSSPSRTPVPADAELGLLGAAARTRVVHCAGAVWGPQQPCQRDDCRPAGMLSEQEVHAAIKLIDQLPALTEHMEQDIMPILATLDRVGPDVHELLNVTRDLRQAILGLPGLAFFRRRGENREDDDRDARGDRTAKD